MSTLFALLLALLAGQPAEADASPAPAETAGPVVVELFTSQGCPMCPGANALLGELADEPGVIAVAYGVSYWDVYGWTDEFAMAEFAARQQAYVDTGEAHRVYTPHFVVNGSPEKLRYSQERIRTAVASAAPLPVEAALSPAETGWTLTLDGPARIAPAQIWRVDFEPGLIEREIGGGPNEGKTVSHYQTARALTEIGAWSGGPLTLAIPPAPAGRDTAILIQDGPGGPLLAAAHAH
ncbi:MAG: DUF1223 domain-containing protein [Oceanicaulis sp.]